MKAECASGPLFSLSVKRRKVIPDVYPVFIYVRFVFTLVSLAWHKLWHTVSDCTCTHGLAYVPMSEPMFAMKANVQDHRSWAWDPRRLFTILHLTLTWWTQFVAKFFSVLFETWKCEPKMLYGDPACWGETESPVVDLTDGCGRVIYHITLTACRMGGAV